MFGWLFGILRMTWKPALFLLGAGLIYLFFGWFSLFILIIAIILLKTFTRAQQQIEQEGGAYG